MSTRMAVIPSELRAMSTLPKRTYSDSEVNQTSCNSIISDYQYTSLVDDSLLNNVRDRNSISSKPVFGFNPYTQHTYPLPSRQSRPLRMMNEMRVHSSLKEDGIVITVRWLTD